MAPAGLGQKPPPGAGAGGPCEQAQHMARHLMQPSARRQKARQIGPHRPGNPGRVR